MSAASAAVLIMALFLPPSPFEGEGWDGGGAYNQALNPLPSPPPDRRRELKSHSENCC